MVQSMEYLKRVMSRKVKGRLKTSSRHFISKGPNFLCGFDFMVFTHY